MTKNEYKELFDLLSYGHDADLSVAGQRYFLEWNEDGMAIYQMNDDTGDKIAMLRGNDKFQVVNELFDFAFTPQKTLNTWWNGHWRRTGSMWSSRTIWCAPAEK